MRTARCWPFILVLLLAACAGAARAPQGSPTGVRQPQDIAVTLSPFKFEPSTITVGRGEPVRFALHNVEGVHTFTIKELNLDITLEEGQVSTSPIVTPAGNGEFRLVCRFHELSGMVGTLLVGEAAPVVATPTQTAPTPTVAGTPITATVSPTVGPTREAPTAAQELAEIENYAASRFYPDRFIAIKGIPVRLYVTRLHREHVNRFSIEPFLRSTAFFPPGTVGVIEFTPDQTGEFRIRNEGHGYEAALSVVGSAAEARDRSIRTGIQELSLIHDFANSRLVPQRLVVQPGVPVRMYNSALGWEDKVSIAPFYLPTAINIQQGKITVIEFTPVLAGEFPITYEQHGLSGTLVVGSKP